jgi:sugar lactone lactonase YvrE
VSADPKSLLREQTLDAPACTAWRGPDLRSAYRHGLVVRYPRAEAIVGMRRWQPAEIKSHALPEMSSVLARVDADRQMIATETGLHLRTLKTGALELVTPIEAENPVTTRSNDGRVHPCGALWIGTMGKTAETGRRRDLSCGTRHRHNCSIPDITIPNAICFSPDGATAYFTDTITASLMRVAIDPDQQRCLYRRASKCSSITAAARAGSMARSVMRDGVVWNARWGAGCGRRLLRRWQADQVR